jgi:phosphoribosylformimino-5-aminoimidazole carboxamide ribotide isomerase
MADRFGSAGAGRIHVVDLDGARAGKPVNLDAIRAIARAGVPFEVGGGLRRIQDVAEVLSLGAGWVVLGTAAVERLDLVAEACRLFPGRIVCGIDARDGDVAVKGWEQGTGLKAADVGRRVRLLGVTLIEYTDVSRDGVFAGVDAAGAARLQADAGVQVVASGGVASLDDIRACREAGLGGVIVGKAIYEGRVDLAAAVRLASGSVE